MPSQVCRPKVWRWSARHRHTFPFGMHLKSQNLPAGCWIFPGRKPATLDRMYRSFEPPRIARPSIPKLVVPLNHYPPSPGICRVTLPQPV